MQICRDNCGSEKSLAVGGINGILGVDFTLLLFYIYIYIISISIPSIIEYYVAFLRLFFELPKSYTQNPDETRLYNNIPKTLNIHPLFKGF